MSSCQCKPEYGLFKLVHAFIYLSSLSVCRLKMLACPQTISEGSLLQWKSVPLSSPVYLMKCRTSGLCKYLRTQQTKDNSYRQVVTKVNNKFYFLLSSAAGVLPDLYQALGSASFISTESLKAHLKQFSLDQGHPYGQVVLGNHWWSGKSFNVKLPSVNQITQKVCFK